MTKIRAMVVDDEAMARERVVGMIRQEQDIELIGECSDGQQAVDAINTQHPDLVFLDVQMPAVDGFRVIEQVGPEKMPAVVFVTAYDEYAVRAFELAAIDYLLKPVRAARLAEALAKARRIRPPADEILRQMAPTRRSHFSINERGRILLVPVGEVLYLKAEQKYVVARSREREFLLDESLVQLEEEFPERFLRIHRNCLIARNAVKGVARATTGMDGESHWVIIVDGLAEQLPVSRRQWPAVKEALGV